MTRLGSLIPNQVGKFTLPLTHQLPLLIMPPLPPPNDPLAPDYVRLIPKWYATELVLRIPNHHSP